MKFALEQRLEYKKEYKFLLQNEGKGVQNSVAICIVS